MVTVVMGNQFEPLEYVRVMVSPVTAWPVLLVNKPEIVVVEVPELATVVGLQFTVKTVVDGGVCT